VSATDSAIRSGLRAKVEASLGRRYAIERMFRWAGAAAIGFAALSVAILLGSIGYKAAGAFTQSIVEIEVRLDPGLLEVGPAPDGREIRGANYRAAIKDALLRILPDATDRKSSRALLSLLSPHAEQQVKEALIGDPALLGREASFDLLLSADADIQFRQFLGTGEDFGRMDARQLELLDRLVDSGRVSTGFNRHFFARGDSRDPEIAGVLGALMGSLFTLLVVAALSFPIGVAAAIYLEEFAPKNRWTDLIEVNINNLAAVPSIIFGLLGLAVFLNMMGMPRSAPLVGGLVLTLMTLPTVVIAARASIRSVPSTLREAALGLGASKTQMVLHHVVPSAMPGILTGSIIGMARALGETAPLLMIGMVAFIVEVPGGILDSSTTLPVQIFLWADSPERAFVERTSAATVVLLGFLLLMNLGAVLLRNKFDKRW